MEIIKLEIEYETKKEQREHAKEMHEKGYDLVKQYVGLALDGKERIISEYRLRNRNTQGNPISKGSIK